MMGIQRTGGTNRSWWPSMQHVRTNNWFSPQTYHTKLYSPWRSPHMAPAIISVGPSTLQLLIFAADILSFSQITKAIRLYSMTLYLNSFRDGNFKLQTICREAVTKLLNGVQINKQKSTRVSFATYESHLPTSISIPQDVTAWISKQADTEGTYCPHQKKRDKHKTEENVYWLLAR